MVCNLVGLKITNEQSTRGTIVDADDKEYSGCLPSPPPLSPKRPAPIHSPACQTDCSGSGGSVKSGPEDSITGKSLLHFKTKLASANALKPFRAPTLNYQEAKQPTTMYGKTTQELKEVVLNMEQSRSKGKVGKNNI